MGDFWSAYGLGVSMIPPRPACISPRWRGVPGYDPALATRQGVVLVYRDRLDAREAHRVFPDLDLATPERLTLPFARTLSARRR